MTPMLRILYGPPGTGKTWRAAWDAVRLLEPTVKDSDISDRHRALVETGRLLRVTFHPSYAYEDFVEGFRPEVKDVVGMTYVARPGPFLEACRRSSEAPTALLYFQVGQIIETSTKQRYEVVHCDRGGLVLRNVKGK